MVVGQRNRCSRLDDQKRPIQSAGTTRRTFLKVAATLPLCRFNWGDSVAGRDGLHPVSPAMGRCSHLTCRCLHHELRHLVDPGRSPAGSYMPTLRQAGQDHQGQMGLSSSVSKVRAHRTYGSRSDAIWSWFAVTPLPNCQRTPRFRCFCISRQWRGAAAAEHYLETRKAI